MLPSFALLPLLPATSCYERWRKYIHRCHILDGHHLEAMMKIVQHFTICSLLISIRTLFPMSENWNYRYIWCNTDYISELKFKLTTHKQKFQIWPFYLSGAPRRRYSTSLPNRQIYVMGLYLHRVWHLNMTRPCCYLDPTQLLRSDKIDWFERFTAASVDRHIAYFSRNGLHRKSLLHLTLRLIHWVRSVIVKCVYFSLPAIFRFFFALVGIYVNLLSNYNYNINI